MNDLHCMRGTYFVSQKTIISLYNVMIFPYFVQVGFVTISESKLLYKQIEDAKISRLDTGTTIKGGRVKHIL